MDIQIQTNDSLSLITKAEIDVQISTAKAFPRSMKNFLDRAMSIATTSESIAESCGYAVARGGDIISGPSVRLAEIAASSYGNIRYGARVISNDGRKVTAQGICHDLETNTSVTIEVSRSILQNEYKEGRRTGNKVTMNEDMQILTGNAACSIALRNAVFKVIPSALINEVYQETKKLVAGTAQTLPARREKAIGYLKGMGVKESQICDALGIARIEDIDLEKLAILRGMVAAINNGESTVKDMFEPEEEKDKKATPEFTRALEMLAECTTQIEVKNLGTKVPIERFSEHEKAVWIQHCEEKSKSL